MLCRYMVCVKGMHTKQPDAVLTEISAGVTGKLPALVLIDAPLGLTSDTEAETVIGVLEVTSGLFCFCVVCQWQVKLLPALTCWRHCSGASVLLSLLVKSRICCCEAF